MVFKESVAVGDMVLWQRYWLPSAPWWLASSCFCPCCFVLVVILDLLDTRSTYVDTV